MEFVYRISYSLSSQATHWFHVQVRIPNEFAGEEVHFIWNADNEALVWGMDGTPVQGLTGGGMDILVYIFGFELDLYLNPVAVLAGNDARHEYVLTTRARGGDPIQFYIEMACNGMFGAGNGLIGPPDPNRFFNLNELVCLTPSAAPDLCIPDSTCVYLTNIVSIGSRRTK